MYRVLRNSLLTAAIIGGLSAGPSFGQTGTAHDNVPSSGSPSTAYDNTARNNRDWNFGWLGLIGLAGLAGLMGRSAEDYRQTSTTRGMSPQAR